MKKTLKTPHGTLRLAAPRDRRRMQRVAFELQRTTDALTRRDIGDWRQAWQMAINIDNPDRRRLYDIYRDVDADLHLSGCISQRTGFVMARSFKITDASGTEHEEARHFFDREWFKQLLRYALESIWWGHSLIELGDLVTDEDGQPTFDGVTLLPRKHVIPEYHRIVIRQGDDWHNGLDYRDEAFACRLIEAGRPDDLGLYLKAALQTIPKKNMLAFWDTFGEIFGMPMRIARTTSRDDKVRQRLNNMLQQSGASLTMVADMDTEIQFVETGRTDSYNVYDRRIDRANSELSKLVIGQTMTIEDGSSLSQSQTHLKVFQNLVEADCDMLRDMVNNQLLPRMLRLGFPLQGLHFDWDYSVDYTPEQQVAYETMVADRYEVSPEYFAEKYSMPVGKRREPTPSPEPDPSGKSAKSASHTKSFFD